MEKHKIINIGIMGFGSIGRDFYRIAQSHPKINIKTIVDIGRPEILHYLLQCDGFQRDEVKLIGDNLETENSTSKIIQAEKPDDISWEEQGVDYVFEATHKYSTRTEAEKHISAGAKKVIISTLPTDEFDRVIIMGVNENTISKNDKLISAGSSTTNAFGLMLKIFNENYKVDRVMMTTIHSYTSDQPLHDTAGKNFRRSRSAAENIIPNTSPSPKWMEKIIPKFKGKLEGIALNVPIPNGSLLDMTTIFENELITVRDINNTMKNYAEKLPNLIETTDDPIVSSDVLGNTHSLLFDTRATMKSGKRIIKTLCWYDNRLGHAARILDIINAYRKIDQQ